MKIKSIELFHTPTDWDELMAWINGHNGAERPHILTAAGMAWNLAAKVQAVEPLAETLADQLDNEISRIVDKVGGPAPLDLITRAALKLDPQVKMRPGRDPAGTSYTYCFRDDSEAVVLGEYKN